MSEQEPARFGGMLDDFFMGLPNPKSSVDDAFKVLFNLSYNATLNFSLPRGLGLPNALN